MNRRNFNIALCKTAGSLIASELIWGPSFAQGKRAKQQPANGSQKNSKRSEDPQNPKAKDDSKLFHDPDGDFTIVFPAEPRYELDQRNVSVTYFAAIGGHVLGVIVGFNQGTAIWTPNRVTELRSSFDEVISSRLVTPSVLELTARLRSQELNDKYKELAIHSVFTHTRYYSLFVRAEPEGDLDRKLARAFFSSFKLTPEALARRQQGDYQGRPGQPQPAQVKCSTCRGTGRITCYRCRGTGKGDIGDPMWWCRRCYGNGYQTCYSCNGTGERWL